MFSVLFLLFLLSSFCWGEWDLEKREEQEEREEERREGKRALSCGRAKKIKEREEGEEIPVWVKIEIENMIQVNDKEARVLFDLSVVMIWDIETVPLEFCFLFFLSLSLFLLSLLLFPFYFIQYNPILFVF